MIKAVSSARPPTGLLVGYRARAHARQMFAVDEATAEAIRRALREGGELSAVVELRRHVPLLTPKNVRKRWVSGKGTAS